MARIGIWLELLAHGLNAGAPGAVAAVPQVPRRRKRQGAAASVVRRGVDPAAFRAAADTAGPRPVSCAAPSIPARSGAGAHQLPRGRCGRGSRLSLRARPRTVRPAVAPDYSRGRGTRESFCRADARSSSARRRGGGAAARAVRRGVDSGAFRRRSAPSYDGVAWDAVRDLWVHQHDHERWRQQPRRSCIRSMICLFS